ncbi:MAG: hypothetical protein K1X71_11290 [Pirellulales bacterium]|nr:hypothetical protein [Pirellulales bacterium]
MGQFMRFSVRPLLNAAAIIFLTLASAEIVARLDDYLRQGVRLNASPDPERDLQIIDARGRHGTPHGAYKRWRLNRWGFNAPELSLIPASGVDRVMVLSASEAFGLFESPGKEFPAQLDTLLRQHGDYEVVNASVTGMTVGAMNGYWRNWVGRFRPAIVIVYASPLFYLSDIPPDVGSKANYRLFLPPPKFQSRFVGRLRDLVDVPQFAQDWLDQRAIAAQIANKPVDWLFESPPLDRLDLFESHVRMLCEQIVAAGGRVVLCTHAVDALPPFSPAELRQFESGRVHLPRATAATHAQFHVAGNQRLRQFAARSGYSLADIDAALSGQARYFADLAHFTDQGAERVAQLLDQSLSSLSKQLPSARP